MGDWAGLAACTALLLVVFLGFKVFFWIENRKHERCKKEVVARLEELLARLDEIVDETSIASCPIYGVWRDQG